MRKLFVGLDLHKETIQMSVMDRAGSVSYGHITHEGSSMMRWALVQGASIHIQNRPAGDLAVFYKKIANKRSNSVAMVAAAAKLLRMMYWVLKERREFVTNYGQGVSCGQAHEGKPRQT